MKTFVKKILGLMASLFYLPKIMKVFKWVKNNFILCAYEKRFYRIGKNCCFGDNLALRHEECIEIGDNFAGGQYLTMEAWKEYQGVKYSPHISIGNDVLFTNFVQISCIDEVTIGDNVLLGNAVYISDNDHGQFNKENLGIPPAKRELNSKGPVRIGNNVWIGRHVSVLSGVTIGDNSVIGANSVVTKDIPPNCVAVGSPAKIIKSI